MTGTDFCVNKPHQSRSYLKHLVYNKNLLFNVHGMKGKENKKNLLSKYSTVLTDTNTVIIIS
jgi:hypothetical protein